MRGEAIAFVETHTFVIAKTLSGSEKWRSFQRVGVFLLTFIRSENAGLFWLLARLISQIALYIDVHFFLVDTG